MMGLHFIRLPAWIYLDAMSDHGRLISDSAVSGGVDHGDLLPIGNHLDLTRNA